MGQQLKQHSEHKYIHPSPFRKKNITLEDLNECVKFSKQAFIYLSTKSDLLMSR